MANAHLRRGFTRVDSLGVLLVLTILVSVSAVGMTRSRVDARGEVAKDNMQNLVTAIASLTADMGAYPPCFTYGADVDGIGWDVDDQIGSHPMPINGYVHWSGVLLEAGYVRDESTFSSPDVLNGGAPRTNPGDDAADWEPGQTNALGGLCCPGLPEDRQASRLAFVPNAALMPTNNFMTNTPRRDEVVETATATPVAASTVTFPAATILLTEFLVLDDGGWASLTAPGTSLVLSHRPVTPFLGLTAGTEVHDEPDVGPIDRFRYPSPDEILEPEALGPGQIVSPLTSLNAVGRHRRGGTAYFARADGAIHQQTVEQTVTSRQWGNRFYSITGNDAVLD